MRRNCQRQRFRLAPVEKPGLLPCERAFLRRWGQWFDTPWGWQSHRKSRGVQSQLFEDNLRNGYGASQGEEMQRARLVKVDERAGVGNKPFHLPGVSRTAQATSCNCCCSINS